MSFLKEAFEYGCKMAQEDFFNTYLSQGLDNPTMPVQKSASLAKLRAAIEKTAEPKGKKIKPGSRKGGKSQPAAKAPAGKGTRFQALKKKLSKQKNVTDPGALAAAIGRSKFGKGKFQRMAAKG